MVDSECKLLPQLFAGTVYLLTWFLLAVISALS